MATDSPHDEEKVTEKVTEKMEWTEEELDARVAQAMEHHKRLFEEAHSGEWRSCCFSSDREAVKYLLTYLLSLIILGFSFFRLTTSSDELALWMTVISGISGTYLPSPLLGNKSPP
jgi:hypothetical protein